MIRQNPSYVQRSARRCNPLKSCYYLLPIRKNPIQKCLGIVIALGVIVYICGPSMDLRRFIPFQKNGQIDLDSIRGTNRSLTVVTAFFNIGSFPKGKPDDVRSTDNYTEWMRTYSYMKNPVVFYTDDETYIDFFSTLRKNAPHTKFILVNRTDLWAFQILPNITKIYSNVTYPEYYPNTNNSEYTCVTHSKLQLLALTVQNKSFDTDYFCWVDAGYFRDISHKEKKFWLEVPDDFDKSRIAVTRVYDSDLEKTTAKDIILKNLNWVGGGLFLGTPEVILKFHDQYQKAVMRYLGQGIMNVEQHILFAMYTRQERNKYSIRVELQRYTPGQRPVVNNNDWFYLGYVMYRVDPR
uniref:Uncharacterized protein LOC111110322 n=1 Tax=Crassostrea virginica TaxID=6565 RepID=A0A8B8BGU2_CRAVI|nr:uncharacterized protein LOC111110322 [Crassostrea virginica]